MAKKKKVKKRMKRVITRKMNKHLAITGLVINILVFFLPGIGSLIGGRYRSGGAQILIAVVGIVFLNLRINTLGILIMIGVWIWALMTGISMVQDAYS